MPNRTPQAPPSASAAQRGRARRWALGPLRRLAQHPLARVGVSVLLLAAVGAHVMAQPAAWAEQPGLQGARGWLLAAAALALLPVNLGLEVLKWRWLGRAWGLTRTRSALAGVLAGHVLGMATPARLGEYAGRLWAVRPRLRMVGLVGLAVSRLGQLAAALLLAGGLLAVADTPLDGNTRLLAAGALVAVGAAVLAATLAPGLAFGLLGRVGLVRRLSGVLPRHSPWSRRRLGVTAAASALRHGVIVAQLVLLALAFWPAGAPAPLGTLVLAAALAFVLKAGVPTVALAELGVREAVAVGVASWLSLPQGALFQATLALFLINLLLPALASLPVLLPKLIPARGPEAHPEGYQSEQMTEKNADVSLSSAEKTLTERVLAP